MLHAPSPSFARSRLAGAAGASPSEPAAAGVLTPQAAGSMPQSGPGLRALPPESVSEPSGRDVRVAALSPLQDGGFAIAWLTREGADLAAPWQLQVQRYSRTYERSGDAVCIPWKIADEGVAVCVLPDATTVVAWREIATPRPDEPWRIDWSLRTSRFDAAGLPVGEPSRVHAFSHDQGGGQGRRLDHLAIASWPDGSHVVAWADVTLTPASPGLLATIQARRYDAQGEPAGPPVTVGGSAAASPFELQALACMGGYAVTRHGPPAVPSDPVIRLVDLRHPIDPSRLSGLAAGSLLVPLGVCGHLLFAGRTCGDPSHVRWERQLFNWSGQPVGEPVPLPGPPQQAVPLRQLGQFLALTPSPQPGGTVAQRMDKYGALYGTSFSFPGDRRLPLDDGGLVTARVFTSPSGLSTVMLQRFADPYEGQWLPE